MTRVLSSLTINIHRSPRGLNIFDGGSSNCILLQCTYDISSLLHQLEWLLDDSKRAAASARAAAGNKASSSDPSHGLSPTSSLHRAIFSNPSIILGLCNPRALISIFPPLCTHTSSWIFEYVLLVYSSLMLNQYPLSSVRCGVSYIARSACSAAVLQMLEQPESQVPWLLNDGVDLHSWVHSLSQVYHAERHAVPLSERRIPVDHRGRPLRTVRH